MKRLFFDGTKVLDEESAVKAIPGETPYCYRMVGVGERPMTPEESAEWERRGGVGGTMPVIRTSVCPFWRVYEDHVEGDVVTEAYCLYLGSGDREYSGLSLLFDQVKECGLKDL